MLSPVAIATMPTIDQSDCDPLAMTLIASLVVRLVSLCVCVFLYRASYVCLSVCLRKDVRGFLMSSDAHYDYVQ